MAAIRNGEDRLREENWQLRERWRFYAVIAAVAVALLVAAAALVSVVTSNKERAENALGDADVVCKQVLKLRNANLKGVDIFEAAVVEGWKRRDPGEEVTEQERATAGAFFKGQRDVLKAVHCP